MSDSSYAYSDTDGSDDGDRNDSQVDDCEAFAGLEGLDEVQQERLTALLDEYLCALESGEPISRSDLIARQPELADALTTYLDTLDAMHGVATGFNSAPQVAGLDASGRIMAQDESAVGIRPGSLPQIGGFEILNEVGRGGMGIVYRARDNSADRFVALKLLPMHAVMDAKQISRFRNESRAAGQLNHPHIVPVYNVGSDQGIHFYTMPLIEGLSVDQWIPAQPALVDGNSSVASSGTDVRGASWQSVVNAVAFIADALQSTHEHGIVHRDIKPSNLILEGHQQPNASDSDQSSDSESIGHLWVTDFGLARSSSQRSLTVSGEMIGTMRYMSPEQASGRAELVDHRTDIYSLAATIFEMLTLRPVIEGDDGPSLLRKITDNEPPRLRKLRPDTPSDLSTVLGKAMSRDREDRYTTAGEFATDLRAVVAGDPVSAVKPSIVDQVIRWGRRHSGFVAAAMIVMAVTTVALGIVVVTVTSAAAQKRDSDLSTLRYLRSAHRAVDRFGLQHSEAFSRIDGYGEKQLEILNEVKAFFEDFLTQAEGDPQLRRDLASTYQRLGSLSARLEGPSSAAAYFQKAALIYRDLLPSLGSEAIDVNDQTLVSDVALNFNNLGLALLETNELQSSLTSLQTSERLSSALVGNAPEDIAARTRLASTQASLGLVFTRLGQTDRAHMQLDGAAEALTELASEIDQSDESSLGRTQAALVRRTLAGALTTLGGIRLNGDPKSSVDLFTQALEIQQALSRDDAYPRFYDADRWNSYDNLGAAYLKLDQPTDALGALQSSVEIGANSYSANPQNGSLAGRLARSLTHLAVAQMRAGATTESVRSATRAVEIQADLLGTRPYRDDVRRELVSMMMNRGDALDANGDLSAANSAFVAAKEVLVEIPLAESIGGSSTNESVSLVASDLDSAAEARNQAMDELYRRYLAFLRRNDRWSEIAKLTTQIRGFFEGDADRLLGFASLFGQLSGLAEDKIAQKTLIQETVATLSSAQNAGGLVNYEVLQDHAYSYPELARQLKMTFQAPPSGTP